MSTTNTVRYPATILKTFISTALHSLGIPEDDADDDGRDHEEIPRHSQHGPRQAQQKRRNGQLLFRRSTT